MKTVKSGTAIIAEPKRTAQKGKPMSNLISTQDAVAKVVDYAIRNVLSGEQKLTKEYEQSVKEAVNVILDTAKRTDGDLISRQAAIDAVCMEWCNVKHQDCKHPFDVEKDDYYWCDGCETALRTLPDLPSAQQDCTECEEYDHDRHFCPRYCKTIRQTLEEAKQERTGRWIPCSERLPDQYGNYLISIDGEEPDIGTINPNDPRGWSLCDANGFYWASDKALNITAWMPLPECYRGENDETD